MSGADSAKVGNREDRVAQAGVRQAWFICVCFSLFFFARELDIDRHLIYSLPFLSLLVFLGNTGTRSKLVFDKLSVKAAWLYGFAFFLSFVSISGIQFFVIRDYAIITGVFLTFLPNTVVTDKMVKFLFVVYASSKTLDAFAVFNTDIGFTQLFIDSTTGISETNSFQFAVFALYFLYKKDYHWFLAACFFNLVAFKRISILAMLGAIFTYRVLPSDSGSVVAKSVKRSMTMVYIWTVVVVFYLFAVNLELIARTVLDLMGYTDMSTNYFMKGRVVLHGYIHRDMALADTLQIFFGHGAGAADELLKRIYGVAENPHNDFLKLQYEYGYVGMALYWIALWTILSRNNFGISIFIYTITIFPTDNILIYYPFQLVALLAVKATMDTSPAKSVRKVKSESYNTVLKRALEAKKRSVAARGVEGWQPPGAGG